MTKDVIHSPNTVLAKYLTEIIDIIRPRLEINKPKELLFYVGTNINGTPHIGTYLVHSLVMIFLYLESDLYPKSRNYLLIFNLYVKLFCDQY